MQKEFLARFNASFSWYLAPLNIVRLERVEEGDAVVSCQAPDCPKFNEPLKMEGTQKRNCEKRS